VGFRTVVAVIAAAGAAIAVAIPSFAASEVLYCNELVSAFSSCGDRVVGVAYHNAAAYRGSGTVSVCQRGDSGSSLLSRRCANGYVSDGSDLNYWHDRGVQMVLRVGNNDNNRHTIYGESKGYALSAYD